jgi:hypothetical protein
MRKGTDVILDSSFTTSDKRSNVKNLMEVGVSEKIAMIFADHRTLFAPRRCPVVDTHNVVNAMRNGEAVPARNLSFLSESSVEVSPGRRPLQV